jgi:hypothetical protein
MKSREKTYQDIHDDGKSIASNILSMKDLQIRKWQQIAFTMGLVTVMSVSGVIYVSTRATFIPYMVGIDEKTGAVQSLGSLKDVSIEPTDATVNYFLSRFVEEIRTIPLDKQILNRNVDRAIRFFTPESANKFKSFYLNELTQKIGTGVNRVDITSVTPVSGSKNTYQVRWKETFTQAGSQTDKATYYTSIFTIEQSPVTEKEILQYNPLGLFIKDFSITEEQQQGGTKK